MPEGFSPIVLLVTPPASPLIPPIPPKAPARSLRVRILCGEEEQLYGGSEPSTCVYDAYLTTPAVCTEGELEGLQVGEVSKQRQLRLIPPISLFGCRWS